MMSARASLSFPMAMTLEDLADRFCPRSRASPAQPVRLRSLARSGESSADKPPLLAATSSSRLLDALESVCLEQGNRPYIRGSLVNAVAAGVHWVTLNHNCAAGAGVLNCAVQQVVHQPTAPEPRSHPEADR